MKLSQAGRDLLIQLEGLKKHIYLDSGNRQTIGIGHLLTAEEKKTGRLLLGAHRVNYAMGITEQQAKQLLDQDILPFEHVVSESVNVELQPHEFDALVIFALNIGAYAFRKSTLLKQLNAGYYSSVPMELMRWNKINGKESDGLTNRRKSEVKLWLSS